MTIKRISRLFMVKGEEGAAHWVPYAPDTHWYYWSPHDATKTGLHYGAKVMIRLLP